MRGYKKDRPYGRYEKLCLKYTKIPEAFNIQSMNNSKEFINSSKQNRFRRCCTFDTYII